MKEQFNSLISDLNKSFFKVNGFSKKALNFYKRKDDLIFLFNFQNSQGNTSDDIKFYINCAIHSTVIDKTIGKTELLEPKEPECYFRKRISALTKTNTNGYFINERTDLEAFKKLLLADLQKILLLFASINCTMDLVDLMIEENGLYNHKQLFKYLLLSDEKKRQKKYIKYLYESFGAEERWATFESNLNKMFIESNRAGTVMGIIHEK